MEPGTKPDSRIDHPDGTLPIDILGRIGTSRLVGARVLGVIGLLAYNWWVLVPFKAGLLPSSDGFFSDLEANGRPYATVMQHLDVLAGIILIVALVLRGPMGRYEDRGEWPWLVGFAAAGAVGGEFPYACAEGMSASCRHLEWRFRLPLHHYIHVISGVAEFATITLALVIAYRRTRGRPTPEARLFRRLTTVFIVAYPLIGVAYLGDRLGAYIEPVFFVTFSLIVLAELFEPAGRIATGISASAPWRRG